MGEYAMFGGERVKIGTCEDLYYLREDQRHLVQAERRSVDVQAVSDLKIVRFRFPFPDEDAMKPGAFNPIERAVGFNVTFSEPMSVDHGTIQFQASVGLLASLPCPNGAGPHPVPIHKNGYASDVLVAQQGFRGENLELRTIVRCGACGAAYSLPRSAAEELVVAIRAKGDSRVHQGWVASRLNGKKEDYAHEGAWWHTVADRVMAGYDRRLIP